MDGRTTRARRLLTAASAAVVTLTALVAAGTTPAQAAGGTTQRVSVSSSGAQSSGWSEFPSISADGTTVVYDSTATDLVSGDTNDAADIFVYDRTTAITERVSVGTDGTEGNANSSLAILDGDGTLVVFGGVADNLAPGAAGCEDVDDQCFQIYARDRGTGTTVLVSGAPGGAPADGSAGDKFAVSDDGRYVVFTSRATNLVPDDTNDRNDVFVRDLQTGAIERVSQTALGEEGNEQSFEPTISADGSTIAFTSAATNLAPGAVQAGTIYVADRVTHAIEARGVESPAASGSFQPALSGDGRIVAWTTQDAFGLGGPAGYHVYAQDRVTGDLERLDVPDGVPTPEFGYADRPEFSADGRFVLFRSGLRLTPDASNGVNHLYVRDRLDQSTDNTSVTSDGGPIGNPDDGWASISGDGRFVTTWTSDGSVVPGDTNGQSDVFVHDRGAPVETASGTGTATTDGESDGAGYLDPVETMVVGPAGSTVTLTETTPSQALPTGFGALGQQVDVDVTPSGTVSDPIVLTFRFDAAIVPVAGDASSIHLFRNGTEVPACTGSPQAVPDPCVSDRVVEADGDVSITARSSHASAWNGAMATVDREPPTISLTTPADGDVFVQGQPAVVSYSCDDGPNGTGVAYCSGTAANGSTIDTSEVRSGSFSVSAADTTGHATSVTHSYSVVPPTAPSISVGDASVVEGDTGTRVMKIPVTLSAAATTTVTVKYALADGTATGAKSLTAGADYVRPAGLKTLTFAPAANGRTPVQKFVSVKVASNTAVEGDQTFTATLSAPTGGYVVGDAQGTGTIVEDDWFGPDARVTVGDVRLSEGSTGVRTAAVALTLDRPQSEAVAVDVQIVSGGATCAKVVRNTPAPDVDCNDLGGAVRTIRFVPSPRTHLTPVTKFVNVPIYGDTTGEGTEYVYVVLTNARPVATGSALVVTAPRSWGAVTIQNDD